MTGMAERAGLAWRRLNTVGIGDNRVFCASSSLLCPSTLQDNIEKVAIRWNLIPQEVVETLGGSEPAYTRERANGLVQARVRFRVPLNNEQSVFQEVEVAGMRCLEVWEAESTAAALALGQLQRGPFHTRILDFSHLQCEEMERRCYRRYLLKADEVLRGVKLMLSDWEDCMVKTEACYKGMYEQVVESVERGINGLNAEILSYSANRIYDLNRASYLQLNKLVGESEVIKGAEWDVRTRAEHHFRGRCHDRPDIRPGEFPREIKVCMKVVLDEMIRSLGWDEPAFKSTTLGTNLHACDVLLLSKRDGPVGGRKTTAIASGRGSSEDGALENACQRALFLLEAEMSIRLVDVNYSQRTPAEMYVLEAEEVAKLAVSIGAKIIGEWESLIDGLQACKEQFWSTVADHPGKEPWNQVYNAKCECAGATTDLHETCLSILVLAKDRHDLG